jgi:citrate lyase beta subunit
LRLCLTFARLSSTDPELSHVRSLLFAPGDDERKLTGSLASEADGVVAWSPRVVALILGAADLGAEGLGMLALNGAMVERPVVEQARRLLAEAEGSRA